MSQAVRGGLLVGRLACTAIVALAIAYGPAGPMLERNVADWLNAFANPRNGDIIAELYADANASDYDAAIAKTESALSK